jgi:SAM-dependent methyltransferase
VTQGVEQTLSYYDTEAGNLAASYEAIDSARLHARLAEHLPPAAPGALALDVGAGTGRDAAWLVAKGFDVVAAEPARGMREVGAALHPMPAIRWIDDRLPDLATVRGLGLAYDLVLLSAVWMHLPPGWRPQAFRRLATLLKPGGLLALTLRNGPGGPRRVVWPTSPAEVEALARDHGLTVVHNAPSEDQRRRADVRWVTMVLRRPDDGASR